MFATSAGTVRRNRLSDFTNVKSNGKIAMKFEDDNADTNYEAHRANLIHSVTPDLDVGVEWRKYNLAFGPLLPEGQQVEGRAKYKF